MDFLQVLSVAQKNSNIKQNVNYYSTKFGPPKKDNKEKRLSDGIKKFLAKKEEEEKQKALEEKKKKLNLLSLRDQKAQNRINKHLKVCKSANKSVLADAINTEDTAITMAGPSQPDEDDYGYVSQEANAFYNKLMNKYNNLPPEKPLFSNTGKKVVKDIASTKDRVKQALKQQEIEESLPHRRKRKSTTNTTNDKDIQREKDYNDKDIKLNDKDDKPKPKKRPPPPPDFMTLLKIAEKKQYEPIIIEQKPKIEEKERLMTRKELIEYQKEKDKREQRERDKNIDNNTTKLLNSNSTINGNSKLAKALTSKIIKSSSNDINKKSTTTISDNKKLPKFITQMPKRNNEKLPDKLSLIKSNEKESILLERKKIEAERKELEAMRREMEEEKRKLEMEKRKKIDDVRSSSSSSLSNLKKVPKLTDKNDKSSSLNNKNIKPKQFPPADVKPRQFPPADVRPRQFPPADVRPRQFPPSDVRNNKSLKNGRPINKRRIYDDSDEEYDSELDDFIDDGPQGEGEDYSKYISEIFGYDKNKYRHIDDEDDNMETTYAQQLKEEFVSTKLGIMEDLEDIQKEALEKKRKLGMKKKKK